MSRKSKLVGIAIIGTFAVVVLAPLLWNLFWRLPGRLDFALHHHRFEKVVEAVKKRSLVAGEQRGEMILDGIHAYYERSASNQYTISLVTADWGHLGTAGYLYVDQSPVRISGDPYCDVDAPGDLWKLGRQVASHWWTISCNLH